MPHVHRGLELVWVSESLGGHVGASMRVHGGAQALGSGWEELVMHLCVCPLCQAQRCRGGAGSSAEKTGNSGLFRGLVSDKENRPEMCWMGSHDITCFQRINKSASSSLWASLIPKACQGLVALGRVPWFESPRALGPKSCAPFSEGLPASFLQTTCSGTTWEMS